MDDVATIRARWLSLACPELAFDGDDGIVIAQAAIQRDVLPLCDRVAQLEAQLAAAQARAGQLETGLRAFGRDHCRRQCGECWVCLSVQRLLAPPAGARGGRSGGMSVSCTAIWSEGVVGSLRVEARRFRVAVLVRLSRERTLTLSLPPGDAAAFVLALQGALADPQVQSVVAESAGAAAAGAG